GLFPKSVYRRTGSADVAKDDRYELRLTLSKREIFLAWHAKEKVGSLRRNIFKHGRLGDNGNEPLYRYKDGNHRVHERVGERRRKRRHYGELGVARSNEYTRNRAPI